jgi:Dolichyl-phosphate-mannose-protein mannosyltransferase
VESDRTQITAVERTTLAAVAAVSLALRVVAYFRYRFDSDEPQHLHVAWGWTVGLVQYRDLFDNHAPLFHMLSAPLLARLGERADILLYMRAPMVVLFAIVLASTYVIARRFYSQRVALWAVVLLSLYPSFFLKSLEYRTDNLWNTVWILALVVIMGGPATRARMFATGTILGVATCVSLKTPLLVIALALAVVGTRFALSGRRSEAGGQLHDGEHTSDLPSIWPAWLVRSAAFLAGAAIAPSLIVVYFARLHALPNLIYCVFEFNQLIAFTHRHVLLLRVLYPFMLALVLWYARRVAAGTQRDQTASGRFFLGMLLTVYAVTLIGFWVLISPRDYLPIMPLITIGIASWIIERTRTSRQLLTSFVALAVISIAIIGYDTSWLEDGTAEHITMMNQVLKLTRPEDPLMDLKGETVYRRRPYYFIFETITRAAVRNGLLPDRVAESVVAAHCHVVQADGVFFPARSRLFLNANFLDLGRLRASGQWIRRDGAFDVAIPGTYVMLDKDGECKGTLDGTPYSGPRDLAAGPHRFEGAGNVRVACLWAPAYRRGFSPFHLKDRDF